MTNPPGEPPNDLTLRLLNDGGAWIDTDTLAALLSAVMTTPREPEPTLIRYWAALLFAAPGTARHAFRMAWITADPDDRLGLLILLSRLPDLDPEPNQEGNPDE